MNVALWIVQGLLAFAVIVSGVMKLFAYEKYKARSEKNGLTGIARGLATFIGIAELAGGIGVMLPMATSVAPWLTAWAAIGLAIMLLAVGFHLRRHRSPTVPAVLFLLAALWRPDVFPTGHEEWATCSLASPCSISMGNALRFGYVE